MAHCVRRGENFHCFAKLDIGLNTLLSWKCLECKMITKFYTNPLKPETKFNINETASISVIGSASTFAAFQTVLAVSYRGGRHDALGASVAVIGCATGKIIDIEVLNKYCYTCRYHENRKIEPPPHKCFMNYDRKKSSSSMEPHATAVLFNRSLKLHGLIYKTMVSDDDSATLKAVRDSDPYKAFGIEVDRIKCSFHIFRSIGNKLREASKIRVPSRRVPAAVRKRIKFSGLRIRQIVTADIERLRKDLEPESLSKDEKMKIFEQNTEVLRENILLAPHHVFGNHEKCPREWSCDTSKPNHLIKIKQYGLFARVEKIVTDLSQNSVHLLHFLNTNIIEQYHGILAKYLSGKRIQYGGADEFQDRVYMGTLDQMTSGCHLSRFYKFCRKIVPERIEKLE
ncbi:Protein of unknown function [Cotesia congregata]|uniref:Mutator-like transposase domain-containing protein n=1 Tax=Cotesia congregata TaxID=51543 RepID=A0A8J2MSQ0_COTCN|nr:Protein of unknown function [Cotesia congregata]